MAAAGNNRARAQTFFIWAGIAALLLLGLIMAVMDGLTLGERETRRANAADQRVIIDALTGDVSGLGIETSPSFDVAETPAEEPAPTEEPMPADEPEPAAETPADEPAAPALSDLQPLRTQASASDWPSVARSEKSLVTAPAPEISERKGPIVVPKRGEKDATASTLYKRAFTRIDEQPLIAFVVTDVGFSAEALQAMLDLPDSVTAALSPYALESEKQIETLRNSGHEVWAMLPVLTARYPQDDPGPWGLIATSTPAETKDRLHKLMAATLGSVGFILPPDEALSTYPPQWLAMLEEIEHRGLLLLSTHGTRSVDQLTGNEKLQAILRRADMVLDSTPSAAFIKSKLAAIGPNLEAKDNHKLVVLLSARPQSIALLKEWLATKPFSDPTVMAPLSAIFAPDVAPPPPEPVESKGHGGGGGGHGGGEKKEAGGHGGGH